MKIKTSELTGAALDWAVAESSDANWRVRNGAVIVLTQVPCPDKRVGCLVAHFSGKVFAPSTAWAQGGPIIDLMVREGLRLMGYKSLPTDPTRCQAQLGSIVTGGPTPLIAAMRCYVASKLGDEAEVPDGLM